MILWSLVCKWRSKGTLPQDNDFINVRRIFSNICYVMSYVIIKLYLFSYLWPLLRLKNTPECTRLKEGESFISRSALTWSCALPRSELRAIATAIGAISYRRAPAISPARGRRAPALTERVCVLRRGGQHGVGDRRLRGRRGAGGAAGRAAAAAPAPRAARRAPRAAAARLAPRARAGLPRPLPPHVRRLRLQVSPVFAASPLRRRSSSSLHSRPFTPDTLSFTRLI